jgi:hypothetical protein
MTTSKATSIERTYDLDTEGAHFLLTPDVKAGLTRRLRADAKKEGIDPKTLGDTRVVKTVEKIGRSVTITVAAGVKSGSDDKQTDDLNDPAPTE